MRKFTKKGLCVLAGSIITSVGANLSAQEVGVEAIEEVVVTGVRGEPRTLSESPIPIDVFSAEQLDSLPQTGLFEALRFLVPSLQFPQRAGGGTATFIASAGLRGLNPDQTLVLVNGKRRHKTSLINTSTGQFSGSAGVDLNMIPRLAIKRIEVLRDGAAAQYGSDAIAGVVNIILDDSSEGGKITLNRGENFDRGDGENVNAGINGGFQLGEDGFVNLSFDFMDKEFSNRARPVPLTSSGGRNLFPLLPDGSLDPMEATIDRLVTTNFGNFPQRTYSSSINAGYQFNDLELYHFSTYSNRDSILDFTFRRPRQTDRAIPEIYPMGFRPTELISEVDFETATGLRGSTNAGFDWDLSINYGENQADWENTVGVNASLGALSPTSFYLGQFVADELTAQLDVTKAYQLASGGSLQVSFGTQFRREHFEINEGEPLSYADGNNGNAAGAQGFPGFSPEAVNDLSRNNYNAYGELGWEPTDKLFLGLAARYEDFDDSAGDELIGKVNARYEVSDVVSIRASANTGFRAPSVQQLGFKGSRGQFVDLDNDGIAETIVLRQTLPSTDPAAQALGASPLVPETSTNFSAGVVFETDLGLSLTVDFFQIDVDDRIALSTQFNRGDGRGAATGGTIGAQVSSLLDAAGFDASLGGVNYFTNAIDTRSKGVDVIASWATEGDFGSLSLTAAYNKNDVSIEGIDANPEELAGLILANNSPIEQFDRARLGTYTDEFPDAKINLSANYSREGFSANIRATQFGDYANINRSAQNDTFNEAQWIMDLELGYDFDSGLSVFAGANNLFNTYPAEVRAVSSLGHNFYDTNTPYGFTGGNWYLRTAYYW